LYPEKLAGDEPEPIEEVKWSMSDYEALIAHSDFYVSNSFAALFLVKELLNAS